MQFNVHQERDEAVHNEHVVSLVTVPGQLEGICDNTDDAFEVCAPVTRVVFFHWHIQDYNGRIVDISALNANAKKSSVDDVRLKAYVTVGDRQYAKTPSELGATVIFRNTGLVYQRARRRTQDEIQPNLIRYVATAQAAYLPSGAQNRRIDILPQLNLDTCCICRKSADAGEVIVCCICLLAAHGSCSEELAQAVKVDAVPKQQRSLLPHHLRQECRTFWHCRRLIPLKTFGTSLKDL